MTRGCAGGEEEDQLSNGVEPSWGEDAIGGGAQWVETRLPGGHDIRCIDHWVGDDTFDQ